jgi:hypothetical protein
MTLLLFIAEPLEVSRSFALQYPCVISSEGGLLTMSSLTDQRYDGVASNHKPPCRKSPRLKGSVVSAWKEKALACALRKKAALVRDANRAVVLEIVRWAIITNHPRMVRCGFVQLRRALVRGPRSPAQAKGTRGRESRGWVAVLLCSPSVYAETGHAACP